jgi:hypothetical protein
MAMMQAWDLMQGMVVIMAVGLKYDILCPFSSP